METFVFKSYPRIDDTIYINYEEKERLKKHKENCLKNRKKRKSKRKS